MRKVLSFVLVLAMILGSVSAVFAFSDTADKTYEDAATVLNELGVISGYADGTFGGGNNITRAEFATMIVNALGFTTKGSAKTGFTDVPADYWAAQAILTAKNLGIIYGKTTTKFAPKDNITCDEAIAMLIRALGYKAEYLMGSFPTSYVNQAMTLDILDDVNVGSVAATRGDVAQLIYNALGQSFVSYNNKYGELVPGGKLIARLGATATDTAITRDLTTLGKGLNKYVGAYGTVYKNAAGTKVYAIAPISTFLTGKFSADGKTFTADKVKYAVDPTLIPAKKYTNGQDEVNATSLGALSLGTTTTYALAVKVSNLTITNVYSLATWDTEVVGQALATTQDEIARHKLLGKSFKLNTSKEIDENYFELVGVNSLSEIKEGDVIEVYTLNNSGSNNIVKVVVGTETVVGKITEIVDGTTTDKYYIDGKEYEGTHGTYKLGQEGTFYLYNDGSIYTFKGVTPNDQYAVVLAADDAVTGAVENTYGRVKLLLANGETVIYKISKALNNITSDQSIKNEVTTTGALVTYDINADNELTTINAINSPEVADTVVDKNGVFAGTSNYINDKTVIFTNTSGTWSVGSKSGVVNSTVSGIVVSKSGIVSAMTVTNFTGNETTKYYVFNSVKSYLDGTATMYKLTGYEGVNEVIDKLAAKNPSGYMSTTVAALTTVTYDAKGNVSDYNTKTSDASVTLNTTATTISADGKTFVDSNKVGYTLADDVVIYVLDSTVSTDKWAPTSSVSVLNNRTSDNTESIKFFKTNTAVGNTYDVVFLLVK